VTVTGQLYPDEAHDIVAVINAHLKKALQG